jgi:hypothetical protein
MLKQVGGLVLSLRGRPLRGIAMSKDYVFLCGVMWTQYASEDAGRELVRALHSEDPDVALLACALLEATPAASRLSVQ